MKHAPCALLFLTMATEVVSQPPQLMSYQAVVRDNTDALIVNSSVGIRISILQGSVNGLPQFIEMHTTETNANGLVSIEIGNGNVLSGDLASIDWSEGPFFLRSETDPNGGSDFTISGTNQLLSVPYALYAHTSGSAASVHFVNEIVYSGPCAPAWSDVDLSSVVGGKQSLVRLKVLCPDGCGYLMFKAKDDPTDYLFGTDTNNTLALSLSANAVGQMVIYTDPDGFIRMKCSSSNPVTLTVLHYQY